MKNEGRRVTPFDVVAEKNPEGAQQVARRSAYVA
jgi:hypothetical protein